MIVLSREAFDTIEFDAACTGDHQAAAREMTRLADTGSPESMPRSEAYVRAGEEWLLADDPAAAANAFTRAIDDGGSGSLEPRVPLARALFLLGQDADAEALLRDLAAVPPGDPRMCDQVAELLVERSDLAKALTWATAGIDLCLGGTPDAVAATREHGRPSPQVDGEAELILPEGDRTELRLLLTLRYRIRNDLGLPEDRYDRLLDDLLSGTG